MIEAYAFLAAFAVLVVVGSAVLPTKLIRYVRGWAKNFGSERFEQAYPDVDYERWVARFATAYRSATIVIAVLGLGVLAWLFEIVQRPDWTTQVSNLAVTYFMLQMLPLVLISLYTIVRYHKLLTRPLQEAKRKASLQRRGLFDFVSPWTVVVAAGTYPLFIVYAIWLDLRVYGNTAISKYCYQAIVAVTLVYALNAFVIYKQLYGRRNPLVSQEGRVHLMGVRVKGGVYGSIAMAWFFSLIGTLGPGELMNWRPFALTVFIVISLLLSLMDLSAPAKSRAGEFGEGRAS